MKHLKKLYILLLWSLIGCEDPQIIIKRVTDPYNTSVDFPYKTIYIDSCQYIAGTRMGTFVLVHKGNCKHCLKTKQGIVTTIHDTIYIPKPRNVQSINQTGGQTAQTIINSK